MRTWIVIVLIAIGSRAFAQVDALERTLLPIHVGEKWGYVDVMGNVAIEPVYERASRFTMNGNQLARVVKDGNAFVIDKAGNIIYDPDYYDFQMLNDSVFIYYSGGHWGLFDFKNEIRTDPNYSSVRVLDQHRKLYVVKDSVGTGVLNNLFEPVVPCIYSYLEQKDNYLLVSLKNKQGVLTTGNDVVLNPVYDELHILDSRYCWFIQGVEGGIFDLSSNAEESLVQLDTGDQVSMVDEHYALVRTTNKNRLRLFHLLERKLTDVPFQNLGRMKGTNDLFKVYDNDGQAGAWSVKGGTRIEPQFMDLQWSAPYFLTNADGNWYLSDSTGQRLCNDGFDQLQVNEKGVFTFKNFKVGMLNTRGEQLIPTVYDQIHWNQNIFKCKRGNQVALYEVREDKIFDQMMIKTSKLYGGSTSYGNSNLKDNAHSSVLPVQPIRSEGWFQDDSSSLWGLRSPEGNIIIPPVFHDVRTLFGTEFAITMRKFEQRDGISYSMVSAENRTVGYGVVNERYGRQLYPPVLDHVDEMTLRSDQLQVFRVRMLNGTFTTIDKTTGRISSQFFASMDTFSGKRAVVMVSGRLIAGKVKNKQWYENILGDDIQLLSQWGIRATSKTGIISQRIWYTRKAEWGYIDETGQLIKIHTDDETDEERPLHSTVTSAERVQNGYAPIQYGERWYLMDSTGYFYGDKPYIDLQALHVMDNIHYLAKLYNPRKGYLDLNGNLVGEINYNRLQSFNNGMAWVKIDDNWGILTQHGHLTILDHPARRVVDFGNGFGAYLDGNQWIFVDSSLNEYSIQGENDPGKCIIRRTSGFSEGLAAVQVQLEGQKVLYGYIDTTFHYVIEPRFLKGEQFKYGRARISVGREYTYIDDRGKRITHHAFSRATDFNEEGLALVEQGNYWGVLNRSGKMVVPTKFEQITMEKGYIHAYGEQTLTIYTSKGKKLRQIEGVNMDFGLKDGVNRVKVNQYYGYIRADGKWLALPKFWYASDFDNGVALIGDRNSTYSINHNMDTIASVPYSVRGEFHNNIVRSKKIADNINKVYYLNTNFNSVPNNGKGGDSIKYFEDGTSFNHGLAAVKEKGRWGMIDTTGTFVIPPIYGAIVSWNTDYVQVGASYDLGLLNYKGEVIVPVECEEIAVLWPEKVLYIVNNQFVGYMSLSGEWIWRSDSQNIVTDH